MSPPLVIVGPTASGKSDLAMAAARSGGPAEIVAVDAMQVYRGMDIGTAKPSRDDRAEVPHHGIDLVDPDHESGLVEYLPVAALAIEAIAARGARPILVAGTGLYLRGLTDPMEIPGSWPEVRRGLEARAALEPAGALHRELALVDPTAAARIEPANLRRIVRALEVCLGSGRPFSSFGPGLNRFEPVPFVQIGLRWTRPALAVRIERRVHQMMVDGLLDEVRTLLCRSPPMSRTARQALGYRELIAHLEGTVSLDEAVAEIVLRTRQYAVRQERWFRRDPRIQWVDIHIDPVAEAVPVISRWSAS